MKIFKYPTIPALIAVGTLLVFSCKKDGTQGPEGPIGLKSLLDVQTVPPSEKCENGGLVVKSGIDKNGNNILDAGEVENTHYVCNGSNAISDKQVILKLGGVSASYVTYPVPIAVTQTAIALPRFNIKNYPGVDSIIMFAAPWGGRNSGGDVNSKTKVELYNFTDNAPINNSAVISSASAATAKFSSSDNIYSVFPKSEFDLGIKVSGMIPGDFAFSGDVIMILYRK
ncbi:DUF7151 family protein [Chitinophaga qingshengii]|uniref:DUF7151 domain-containing protein n=1 Tax=Chitinophaga qingshengii TaxID=1569794 RepID=A0ABR7TG48_9BACT|nr:hypothetical protein [Chitinophaga qingshengii]MBC9929378.1 hypothetical protein [Chitinophaga qingshengii]